MMVVETRSRARLAVVLVCVGLFPDAMRGAEPATFALHIAAQPLHAALQEVARLNGIQIIFLSYLTDGHRAPALDGRFTVDSAMKALLADSMLSFRWVNPK